MKNKTNVISTVLSLSVFMMLFSCTKQEAEWNGTIERENGVQIIKNPKEPIYAEDVISLEEELTFGGADEREEYMFSEIRQIDVDENERIYVLDWQAEHIRVFDKNGIYLLTIGSRGQGPGELNGSSMISISKNELMVTESRRLSFFSLYGKFLHHLLTKDMRPVRTRFGSQGHIIVEESIFDLENPRYRLKNIDYDMNLISEIASSPTFDPQ